MTTKPEDDLVDAVVHTAAAEDRADRTLYALAQAEDLAGIQRLLGVDADVAREILVEAQRASAVSDRQLLARMPEPHVPWYRALLAPVRFAVPVTACLALVMVWFASAPTNDAPITMAASAFVDGPGGLPNTRGQRLVRLDIVAECALDSSVSVVTWPGMGPPPPTPEAVSLRLTWDDDAKRRGFIEVYADESLGATFILKSSCEATAQQLIDALRTRRYPWVTVETRILPRTRTGTGT